MVSWISTTIMRLSETGDAGDLTKPYVLIRTSNISVYYPGVAVAPLGSIERRNGRFRKAAHCAGFRAGRGVVLEEPVGKPEAAVNPGEAPASNSCQSHCVTDVRFRRMSGSDGVPRAAVPPHRPGPERAKDRRRNPRGNIAGARYGATGTRRRQGMRTVNHDRGNARAWPGAGRRVCRALPPVLPAVGLFPLHKPRPRGRRI